MKRLSDYKGDLSSFLRSENDNVDSLIMFYNSWFESKRIPSAFLLVRYEDLHANVQKELRRVLDFLQLHEISNDVITEAAQYASFDNMHRMESEQVFQSKKLRPEDPADAESYKTRKGKVGGFVDYLSETDIEYLNHKIDTQLASFYGY